MAATNQDVEVYQGDSEVLPVTCTDSTGEELDLSTALLTYEAWHKLTGAVLSKTSLPAGGITILNQGTDKGKCEITITADNTRTLRPLAYWHGLRFIPTSGDRELVMEGEFLVKAAHGLEVEPGD